MLSRLFILSSKYLALAIFIGCAMRSPAATNIVLSTDDLQTKINEAAPGDIMVVQGGAYAGNISITKPLTFVRSGTNSVQWSSDVSIQTTGAVRILQTHLGGPVVAANQVQLSLQYCSLANSLSAVNGVLLQLRNCALSNSITTAAGVQLELQDCTVVSLLLTNSKALAKRSQVNGIYLLETTFQGLRLTNSDFFAQATMGSGKEIIIAQSEMKPLSLNGYNVRMAYNRIGAVTFDNCSVTFVGNYVSAYAPANEGWVAVRLNGGDMKAYNNSIFPQPQYSLGYGIFIKAGSCTLVNNSIKLPISNGYGIYADGPGGNVIIKGNAISILNGGAAAISDTARRVTELSYCVFNGSLSYYSGANPYQCITADPVLNPDSTLGLNSPCINAGMPGASFNDRDGTRNDIGATGGPFYQADGMTTEKPLLFWLMPEKQKVWKNLAPTLKVEAAATAGH